MKNKSSYYLAAIASFVIWGFISFCLKPLHIYPSLDVLFFRIFYSAVIISLITFLFRRKLVLAQFELFKKLETSEKKRTLFLTALGGLLLAANWFFYIYVMNHVSIKTASFAYLVCPILTAILSGILLKERLSKVQWIAVGMSALSCMVLGIHSAVELSYSMIVAFSYAFYLISQKKNTRIEKLIVLTFQMLFAAVLLLPFYPFYSSQLPSETSFYLLLLILSVVFTLTPLFLNLIALQAIEGSTMGILLYINPILNFAIAFFYFNEKTSISQWIAYLTILLSIVIFNWKVIREKRILSTKKA